LLCYAQNFDAKKTERLVETLCFGNNQRSITVSYRLVIGLVFSTHPPDGFAIPINGDDRPAFSAQKNKRTFEFRVRIISPVGSWNITFSQEAMDRSRTSVSLPMLDDVFNGAIR